MKATPEILERMSPAERRTFRDNNNARIDSPKYAEAAKHNLALLESLNLKIAPDRELRDGDWQIRKMEIVINDPANEALLLDAVSRGRPPLAAIEPLIRKVLGEEYRSDRHDTVQAGDLVAKRLYALDFEKIKGGEKAMPPGSVAKRAATFRKRK